MKNMINKTHIEGVLYEHDLQLRTTGEKSKNPGTEFIMGTISIATNNDMTNIVPVHFTYVTKTYSSGKENRTYGVLEQILGSGKTWTSVGKESYDPYFGYKYIGIDGCTVVSGQVNCLVLEDNLLKGSDNDV